MDDNLSEKLQTNPSKKFKAESHACKKRKTVEKVVVVKVKPNDKKQKSGGPPSDSWSWRKYGQKPIKGSPYPRGYYRCSTSKGCTAKKQVERCRTDASTLIVTYTCGHNHPGPDLPITEYNKESPAPVTNEELLRTQVQEKGLEKEERTPEKTDELAQFRYSQSTFNGTQDFNASQEEYPFTEKAETTYDLSPRAVYEEQPLQNYNQVANLAVPNPAEENDFYDELDELPTTSSFTELLRDNVFDGRILVKPF